MIYYELFYSFLTQKMSDKSSKISSVFLFALQILHDVI